MDNLIIYEDYKQEIVDAIKEERLYDFICMNSYRIDNDILKELLLECIAVLDTNKQGKELIENLKEYKDWEVK